MSDVTSFVWACFFFIFGKSLTFVLKIFHDLFHCGVIVVNLKLLQIDLPNRKKIALSNNENANGGKNENYFV